MALPSLSMLSGGTWSREEGAGGLGQRHPGRPPGLMQEKSQGGKFPASQAGAQPDPSPHRILEVISLLTPAPPASAGQPVMDASWPGLGFILFFFPEKSERGGSQGSAQGPGLEPHARLDIGNNMGALDFESLRAVCFRGEAVSLWAVLPVSPGKLLNFSLPRPPKRPRGCPSSFLDLLKVTPQCH